MVSTGEGGGTRLGFAFPVALRWPDVALGVVLASATVVYLATLPLNVITPPDEAHALHQAKRLLDGEVLYRDLFDIATPFWTYFMASLFWLFGTTLGTARTAVAVIHGGIVLSTFLICRKIGVRGVVAIVAAAAPIIVCQPVYPVANRHWLVTLMCLALLFWCLPPRRRVVWSLISGIIVGVIVATHQQRGASMGLGVFVFMLVEAFMQARYRDAEPVWALARRIAAFAVGVIAAVGSILAGAVISAGLEPVWYALVVHPLTNYYGTLSSAWAREGPYIAPSTFPLFLKYLLVIPVPGGYDTLDHGREVIEALDGQEVPYVFFALRPRPSEPLVQFIRKHYEPLEGSWKPETIWKRRTAAGGFDAKERAQPKRGDGP